MAHNAAMFKVGVISDTHGLLRPQAVAALRGCDAIVHAGDIGRGVLDGLAALAPVHAIRGNNDAADDFPTLGETLDVTLAGVRFHLVHDLKSLPRAFDASRYDVIVSGHSHRPSAEVRDGVLFLNPGSAGPRRFTLPVAVARLDVHGDNLRTELVELEVGSARR